MTLGQVLILASIVAAVFGVYCMVRIFSYLKTRGEDVSRLLLRLQWFRYMSRYRELTTENQGSPGVYLKGYISSMLIALILVIAGAFLLEGSH